MALLIHFAHSKIGNGKTTRTGNDSRGSDSGQQTLDSGGAIAFGLEK
jgi:hypothetical protein